MNRHPSIQRLTLLGGILFLTANAVSSQEFSPENLIPGLKERAVVLNIVARIVEQDQEEIWNSINSKVTIPGRPVSLKLIGENIVVYAQFTPYQQVNGRSILVAQGQIWINIPNQGVHYQTTMQTIPMEYGEQIYFFPLGKVSSGNEAQIEIQLEMQPYAESAGAPADTATEDPILKGNEIPQ
ncbi:hypothetical protein TREPR_1624 [Treponema primitia ZAS-2]|uniref:Lipoprotein n=1 Tax=Treponema primitia (strain ATCC BAA-887 / DSM 12427 / ZAS-2) TaxID=545694 RepID=F5YNR9_TREPZ|nr:hypothetical protein [Treponema primitia]AEF85482.1 hypothetical protein TREPR_1624 [Treponema primitia ZAS-2]